MSEGDWSSEARGLEKPKRRIPMWVWGCGGGCALMLLVGVILSVFGVKMFRKAMDPEIVWPAIERVLPVVERPAGYAAIEIPFKPGGLHMWTFVPADQSHQVMLFHGAGGKGTEDMRQELFGSDGSGPPGAQPGTLVVQGRTLRIVRHRTLKSQSGSGDGGFRDTIMKAVDGSNLSVELSLPGSPEFTAITYTRQGSKDLVTDEEVLAFLKHFRVPGAVVEPAPPAEPAQPPADGEERDG